MSQPVAVIQKNIQLPGPVIQIQAVVEFLVKALTIAQTQGTVEPLLF